MKRGLTDRIFPFAAVILFVVLAGAGIDDPVMRFTGMTGSTQKNGYGCYCHSENPSPFVNVWVEGPDTVISGESALYSINVAKDSSLTAGFNVAVNLGVLGVVDSTEIYWYEDELTHTEPKVAAGRDTISWEFWYTAPDSVLRIIDTIYSAGNSTNQDTLPNELDYWAFGAKFPVMVLGTPTSVEPDYPVPVSFRLEQNYPNPFNPSTVIRFSVEEESAVLLDLYDAAGRLVMEVANGTFPAGDHTAALDARSAQLSTGVYFYRLVSHGLSSGRLNSAVRKMLLLR